MCALLPSHHDADLPELRRLDEADDANEAGQEVGDHFKDAFDHAVIGMALVGPEGSWLTVNPSLCGIVGYTEWELLATSFQAITHPDDLEADLTSIRQVLSGEIFSYQHERRYVHRRGHIVWVLLSVSLVRDGGGQPLYFIFQVEDITDRKTAEVELKAAHEELKARVAELETRTVELSVVGEMGELLQSCRSVNEAYKIIGRSIRQLFPGEAGSLCVMNAARDHVEAVLNWGVISTSDGYFVPDDCWGLRRNRMHVVSDPEVDLVCQHVTVTEASGSMCLPLMAQRETIGLLHISSFDSSGFTAARQQLARTLAEQVALALANLQLQETLRNQSVRDGLTGLFNRRYLEASLDREINRAERHQRPLSIIMTDVDHFKKFNDNYGHETGDAVLREVGGLLQSLSRKADVACRYGGEEFILILPDASLEDATLKAEQMREAIRNLEVRHHRETVGPVTLSIGVASFPEHGAGGDALIAAADAALYRAKGAGRDRVVVAA